MAIFQIKIFIGILVHHGTTCMISFSSHLSDAISLSKWSCMETYSLLISIHIARTPSQVSSTVGLIWLTGNINPPCPPLRPGRSSSPYAYLISAFMIKWIKTIFNCELIQHITFNKVVICSVIYLFMSPINTTASCLIDDVRDWTIFIFGAVK